MKDGLIMGVVIGLVTGALLFKHSETAKDIINQGEKAVNKELKNIKKKIAPKNNN